MNNMDDVLSRVEGIVDQADSRNALIESFNITTEDYATLIRFKERYGAIVLQDFYEKKGYSLSAALVQTDIEVTLLLLLIARELDIVNKHS